MFIESSVHELTASPLVEPDCSSASLKSGDQLQALLSLRIIVGSVQRAGARRLFADNWPLEVLTSLRLDGPKTLV